MNRLPLVALFVLTLTLIAAPTLAAADETPAQYQQLLDTRGPAIVHIKFILKINMGGEDRQQEAEAPGVIIDPQGLVLASSTHMGGISKLLAGRGANVSATPTDIKVFIGDDTEGLEATLQARDSDLDLAWVKIKDLKDRKLEAVDFTKGRDPVLGEIIRSLRPMPRYFDRALVVGESRIGAMIHKPRDLYLGTNPVAPMFGLPVFAADGTVVGFSVLQIPEDGGPAAGRFQDATNMILPATKVAKATALAREMKPLEEPKDEVKAEPAQAHAKPETLPQNKPAEDGVAVEPQP